MRATTIPALALPVLLALGSPAAAHHPGDKLDEVMTGKEEFFQTIDRPAPAFALVDADGKPMALSDFADRIVVMHFIYAGCPDVCPLHAEKIAEIQQMVNQTPMQDRVQFVTITTDPANDTPEVLKDYGPAHGLDPANWVFLTAGPDQGEDTTRKLVEAYGHKFMVTEDGLQVHGVVTHVVEHGGRWAANFHGLKFDPLNLVLYVNGLTNNPQKPAEPTLWEKIRNWF
ncbi:SCO family protein [Thalassobaculum sp.]|uniref:SCO family protein n=1 Tax=Thalassobaculum sp. TaxID=2022740 RepID=UPI0032EF55D4